ncbi:MAG: insulinase family protein [Bacteroidetes bacterium]|nr:insulinase family protein [Bacteroidota bacterium]
MDKPGIYYLKNGLCVLHLFHKESQVVHCGILLKAGTRDEPAGKEGLAHFIEHSLFKGTEKRKSFHILNRLEVVGGELNAYTTKEETCVHASVMNRHFERALELISDIVFHSVYPPKEVEKEKKSSLMKSVLIRILPMSRFLMILRDSFLKVILWVIPYLEQRGRCEILTGRIW